MNHTYEANFRPRILFVELAPGHKNHIQALSKSAPEESEILVGSYYSNKREDSLAIFFLRRIVKFLTTSILVLLTAFDGHLRKFLRNHLEVGHWRVMRRFDVKDINLITVLLPNLTAQVSKLELFKRDLAEFDPNFVVFAEESINGQVLWYIDYCKSLGLTTIVVPYAIEVAAEIEFSSREPSLLNRLDRLLAKILFPEFFEDLPKSQVVGLPLSWLVNLVIFRVPPKQVWSAFPGQADFYFFSHKSDFLAAKTFCPEEGKVCFGIPPELREWRTGAKKSYRNVSIKPEKKEDRLTAIVLLPPNQYTMFFPDFRYSRLLKRFLNEAQRIFALEFSFVILRHPRDDKKVTVKASKILTNSEFSDDFSDAIWNAAAVYSYGSSLESVIAFTGIPIVYSNVYGYPHLELNLPRTRSAEIDDLGIDFSWIAERNRAPQSIELPAWDTLLTIRNLS